MATFINQTKISTETTRTLSRVNYLLEAIGDNLERLIKEYFSNNPTGEAVALEVFKTLGKHEIKRLAKEFGRKVEEVKKDIGIAVPIIGARLYSAKKFQTYRNEKTGKNSQRKTPVNYRRSVNIESYTPHRIREVPTVEHIFGIISSSTDGVRYQEDLRAE